ncbi:MAG: diguanylate cyclase [Succinivibrio sp.]|nr:diguanylate cyclase [Succinivibrio sp.]
MRQLNLIYEDFQSAIESLHIIKEYLPSDPAVRMVFHLYTAKLSLQQAELITACLGKLAPLSPVIGLSEFPVINPKDPPGRIRVNVLISEHSEFFPFQLACERGQEQAAAQRLIGQLKQLKALKGIELYSANQLFDTVTFVQSLGEAFSDVPIFGSLSKSASFINGRVTVDPDSFSIGSELSTTGISVLAYCGESLEVSMQLLQSWKPIGRSLEIELDAEPPLGTSAIRTIDHLPATEVFHKYLGVNIDQDFLNHVWLFPLLVRRRNTERCFIPIGYNGSTFYFNGRINPGEEVSFSYCTQEDILKEAYAQAQKLQQSHTEALFLYICNNRSAFMRDEEAREFEFYRNCAEDFCYCHSFGEIACQSGDGGVFNSASVVVAMRDSSADQQPSLELQPPHCAADTSSTADSFIISHFFHEITKELVASKTSLESEVEKISNDYKNLLLHIVQTLADTIDAKDRYTNGHSGRVAQYAREISRRLGYTEKEQLDIYMIGLLHDVGKIGVPDDVINKALKLTKDEYDCIKSHPNIGASILDNIKEMPSLRIGAKWHHERYDGKGYPDGLKGEEIPEIARIIAVADAYDAMTSNRVYRDALPQATVRAEIIGGMHKQFDPRFATIMVDMIDDDKEYRMRETTQRKVDSLQKLIRLEDDLNLKQDARHISFLQLVDFGRSMPGGFFVYKAEGGEELLYVNDIVLDMFKCRDMNEFKSLTGFTFVGMVHEDDLERIEKSISMQVASNDKQLDYIEYRIRRKDGEIRWVDDYGRLVNTIEYGEVYFVLIRDITDQHNTRVALTETDHLTGAYNRRAFDEKILRKTRELLNREGTLGMLMLDIDRFKDFNDEYGHLAGDHCLCSVADALIKHLKPYNKSLFRYGGEEFAILFDNQSFEQVLKIAESLRESIRNLRISHEHFEHHFVTISIGVGFLNSEEAHALSDPVTRLIKLADEALYTAKTSGRDSVKFKVLQQEQ